MNTHENGEILNQVEKTTLDSAASGNKLSGETSEVCNSIGEKIVTIFDLLRNNELVFQGSLDSLIYFMATNTDAFIHHTQHSIIDSDDVYYEIRNTKVRRFIRCDKEGNMFLGGEQENGPTHIEDFKSKLQNLQKPQNSEETSTGAAVDGTGTVDGKKQASTSIGFLNKGRKKLALMLSFLINSIFPFAKKEK